MRAETTCRKFPRSYFCSCTVAAPVIDYTGCITFQSRVNHFSPSLGCRAALRCLPRGNCKAWDEHRHLPGVVTKCWITVLHVMYSQEFVVHIFYFCHAKLPTKSNIKQQSNSLKSTLKKWAESQGRRLCFVSDIHLSKTAVLMYL